jgi:hypothetical protein
MCAAVGCVLLTIKNPLAERIFEAGTGVLLGCSIHGQAVGYMWRGGMGTSR